MERAMRCLYYWNVFWKAFCIVLLFFSYHLCFMPGQSFSAGRIIRQLVYLNIPAYNLSLYTQYDGGRWERLAIPVGVGRGPKRKYQTPTGRGELYAKARGVTFQYGEQNPKELLGKTITHSNTFDKKTLKPIRIKMPGDMKSIFMKLNSDIDGQFYKQFVIHETTDWYTVGAPASKGCVRLDREDMQRLYNIIDPSVQEGPLSTSVPIITYYDVAEYYPNYKMVVLHANVYNRPIDYIHEILHDLNEAGIDTRLMNMPALVNIVKQAEAQFDQAISPIRAKLNKAPFERLIHDHEKRLLHFTFYLRFRY